jgi:hypothetical protein
MPDQGTAKELWKPSLLGYADSVKKGQAADHYRLEQFFSTLASPPLVSYGMCLMNNREIG